MNINEIAEQIRTGSSKIILIYAFNAVGKTRLSVAYKDATKQHNGGNHAGVYLMPSVKTFSFGTMTRSTIIKI